MLSFLERQNVKLVLKVIHESTIAALAIQNDQRCDAFKTNTSSFVETLLSLWKMFNVNVPYKHVRLNDSSCRPFPVNDERFTFISRIVHWLDAWESLPAKDGKLSKQTFTSFRHACIVLPQITNYLTEKCGYSYLLTSFLQTDPLEHHFGLYRMMSGANYHVSYLQILEAERRLKISHILKLFSSSQAKFTISTMQEFINSFSPVDSPPSDTKIDLDPFLDELSDLSVIEYDTQTLQSLAFIAGYAAHQYLKRSPPCHICRDTLIIEKDFLIDESFGPQYKLLQLTDRGGLKYPSELVLESMIIVWKILTIIESNSELMGLFVEGPSRKILLDLALGFLFDVDSVYEGWRKTCPSCNVNCCSILSRLIWIEGNCLIANKVKNYNSSVALKGLEKRKLKKFNS